MWEAPAPFQFCAELAPFVVDAVRRGDIDLASRIIHELNVGLVSGDGFAGTCVCVAFLEPRYEPRDGAEASSRWEVGFRHESLADFVDGWPPEIHSELLQQIAHEAKARRRDVPLPGEWWTLSLRWKLGHPMLWRKLRRGGRFNHFVG